MNHSTLFITSFLIFCAIMGYSFQGRTFGDYQPTQQVTEKLEASEVESLPLNYKTQVLNFSELAAFSSSITFAAGSGAITIDTGTGKVDHTGYTPDEAAAQFWNAVEKSFPSIKANILKDNPCPKCKR